LKTFYNINNANDFDSQYTELMLLKNKLEKEFSAYSLIEQVNQRAQHINNDLNIPINVNIPLNINEDILPNEIIERLNQFINIQFDENDQANRVLQIFVGQLLNNRTDSVNINFSFLNNGLIKLN
jgi:hypothetical protein